MTDPPIELEDVKRLALRPGDVLVVRSSRPLTWEQMDDARALLQRNFPDHEVIVLGQGIDLEVMRPEGPPPPPPKSIAPDTIEKGA